MAAAGVIVFGVACSSSGAGGRKVEISQADDGCTPTTISVTAGEKLNLVDQERQQQRRIRSGGHRRHEARGGRRPRGQDAQRRLHRAVRRRRSEAQVLRARRHVHHHRTRPCKRWYLRSRRITGVVPGRWRNHGERRFRYVGCGHAGRVRHHRRQAIGEGRQDSVHRHQREQGSGPRAGRAEDETRTAPSTTWARSRTSIRSSGGTVTLDLAPGAYELACLIAPGEAGSTVDHYQQGMHSDFTVQ